MRRAPPQRYLIVTPPEARRSLLLDQGVCMLCPIGSCRSATVSGLLERRREVRTEVAPNTKRQTLQAQVRANVEPGAAVYTDDIASYRGLNGEYLHRVINHAECYVMGRVHTNGLENFWSLFKRCVKGTYVSMEPFHLFRYLDEEEFRFNNRKGNDSERFILAMQRAAGKQLTYGELTGRIGAE